MVTVEKKHLIWGVGLLVGLIILVKVLKPKSNKNDNSTQLIDRGGYIPEKFPLTAGMKGDKVKAVQRYLNSMHKAGLSDDGEWGQLTTDSVMKYIGSPVISEYQFTKKGLSGYGVSMQNFL